MVSEFKDLTAEAIYDAVAKMIDSKPINNPYIYNHADIHVAIAAGREHERERILKLLSHPTWHDLQFSGRKDGDAEIMFHVQGCIGCRQILLIKGENK
jgi:hypothetical protein